MGGVGTANKKHLRKPHRDSRWNVVPDHHTDCSPSFGGPLFSLHPDEYPTFTTEDPLAGFSSRSEGPQIECQDNFCCYGEKKDDGKLSCIGNQWPRWVYQLFLVAPLIGGTGSISGKNFRHVDLEKARILEKCWEGSNEPRLGNHMQSPDEATILEGECTFGRLSEPSELSQGWLGHERSARYDYAVKLVLSFSYLTGIPVNQLLKGSQVTDLDSE